MSSNKRPYDVAVISPFTDTFMEIHACGCGHRKSNAEVERLEYDGDSIEELKRSVALEVNYDLAGDRGISVEEYIDKEGGYEVSTKIGSAVRIMPCVKFGEVK